MADGLKDTAQTKPGLSRRAKKRKGDKKEPNGIHSISGSTPKRLYNYLTFQTSECLSDTNAKVNGAAASDLPGNMATSMLS